MASNDRREFLGAAFFGAAGGSVAGLPEGTAAAADEGPRVRAQALSPEGAPAAAPGYSPGIAVEGRRVVFVSGQGPKDLKADMETQVRQTFDRIGLVLKAAGALFADVVMLRAYFVHLNRDLPAYRKACAGVPQEALSRLHRRGRHGARGRRARGRDRGHRDRLSTAAPSTRRYRE